jgi:hypothetical protein
MKDKTFKVTEVNQGENSVRIMLDPKMKIKAGERYYQRLRPDGVIELIPTDMAIPKKITKAEFQSAIVSKYDQIEKRIKQVIDEIEKITGIVKELK